VGTFLCHVLWRAGQKRLASVACLAPTGSVMHRVALCIWSARLPSFVRGRRASGLDVPYEGGLMVAVCRWFG